MNDSGPFDPAALGDLGQWHRLRALFDAMPVLIAYVDRDFVYRFNNRQYQETFGFPTDQITGRRVADIVGPEAFERMRPHLEAALAGESVTYEHYVVTASRGERRLLATHLPDTDDAGTVVGIIAAVVDVTERRQIEGALRRTEERYALAVEAGGVGVWELE